MNTNLHKARSAKKDEFYTLLPDIEKECSQYMGQFQDKTVYCNCDDYRRSNFYRYFHDNFTTLGLKKLISTCYIKNGHGLLATYDGQNKVTSVLQGDGDFRSPECLKLLEQSDIVVTNPPFSLFREYIPLMFAHRKKFLVIGAQNAITYREVFPRIRDNQLWLGVTMNGSNRWFAVPDEYKTRENAAGCKVIDGKRCLFVNGVVWFTNLDHEKRNVPLKLTKKYDPAKYPRYDNYDAIESKTADIPYDYDGVVGVPISFLHKYCPDQFEILDLNPYFFTVVEKGLEKPRQLSLKNAGWTKDPFARLMIKKKGPTPVDPRKD